MSPENPQLLMVACVALCWLGWKCRSVNTEPGNSQRGPTRGPRKHGAQCQLSLGTGHAEPETNPLPMIATSQRAGVKAAQVTKEWQWEPHSWSCSVSRRGTGLSAGGLEARVGTQPWSSALSDGPNALLQNQIFSFPLFYPKLKFVDNITTVSKIQNINSVP